MKSQELARYVEGKLNELGLNAWRNNDALTVVFDKPSQAICDKHQLASEGEIAHIICVPGIKQTQVDVLIADLAHDCVLV